MLTTTSTKPKSDGWGIFSTLGSVFRREPTLTPFEKPGALEEIYTGMLVGLLNSRGEGRVRNQCYRTLDQSVLLKLAYTEFPFARDTLQSRAQIMTLWAERIIDSQWGSGDGASLFQPTEPAGGVMFEGVITRVDSVGEHGLLLRASHEAEAQELLKSSAKFAHERMETFERELRDAVAQHLPTSAAERLFAETGSRSAAQEIVQGNLPGVERLLARYYPQTSLILQFEPKDWQPTCRMLVNKNLFR